MKIDVKRNKKYFGQHISIIWTIIGFLLIAAGAFMVVILANTRGMGRGGFGMTSIGFACLVIGAVLLVFFNAIKIKDSEIDNLVEPAKEQFKQDFTDKNTDKNAARIKFERTYGDAKKLMEDPFVPVIFGTFCFDDPNALHKKGSDGKSRSSLYTLAGFALKMNTLCIAERKLSFIDENSVLGEKFAQVSYTDLEKAELIHTEKVGYEGITKYRHLRITNNAGEVVIEFPILADAAADEYVTNINQRITRRKEQASANQ